MGAFRRWHVFPGGVRDIALARSADGGRTFQDPVRVSEDNWKIDACPDDGPAMTIDRRGVLHITWPTLVRDPDAQRMAIFEVVAWTDQTRNGSTIRARRDIR